MVTAIARFSRLGHILVFGRIFGFWRWPAGFQKWSQQLSGFHVWSIFWSSGGYLAFGGSTLLGTVALAQWNWDVSAYFRAQPPDPCFSYLSLFTLDAMALRLGFFVFKLDSVSIDCGLFVRKSFKPAPLMTELFETSQCF